jgi:hypothetical protein
LRQRHASANNGFLSFLLKSAERSDNRDDNARHAECDSLSKNKHLLQISAYATENMLRVASSAFSVCD